MKKLILILALTVLGITIINAQDSVAPKKRHLIPESARLLSRYIKFRSVTGNEKKAGEFFTTICIEKELYTKVLTSDSGSYNFCASLYPLELGKPNIIFLNHIDVVPPGDSMQWSHAPFSGEIADSNVWGRGALDNKSMGIMELMAIARFAKMAKRKNLPYNVTLLCVSSEENSAGKGAKLITEKYLKELNPKVVFGEGGAGVKGTLTSRPEKIIYGISTAQKKELWLRLRVKSSTAGHGSVTPDVYANKKMILALNKLVSHKNRIVISPSAYRMFRELGKIEGGKRGFVLRHIRLFKPFIKNFLLNDPVSAAMVSNTFTITNIASDSGAPNQISQGATAVLDCRLLPESSSKNFIRYLKSIIRDDDIEVEVMLKDFNVEESKPNNFFYTMSDAVKTVHKDVGVVPILFLAFTDNDYFRGKGVPTYGLLPVFLDRNLLESIHNVNERIPISSLENGIDIYAEFLKKTLREDDK
ncbi:MAG: M20/M25/M40 family metallo-hydrolase [Bacteroidetes bacterium]|nr:M20/M25/M40 family metallo-hydrolase [Bacteroidota bacterium]